MLNRNIRCIEIATFQAIHHDLYMLNRNIRCIEITMTIKPIIQIIVEP